MAYVYSLSSSVSPISVFGGPLPILVCPNTEHMQLVYGLRSDTSVIVVLVTTVQFLLFSPIQLIVYLMIIPLGINGCDHDRSKVEELNALMLRFRGGLLGPKRRHIKKLFPQNILSYDLHLFFLQYFQQVVLHQHWQMH